MSRTTVELQKVHRAVEALEAMHKIERDDLENEVFALRDLTADLKAQLAEARLLCGAMAAAVEEAAHEAGARLPIDADSDVVRERFNTIEDKLKEEAAKR